MRDRDFSGEVAEVITWLAEPSAVSIVERTTGWEVRHWERAFTALRIHGVAAFLQSQLMHDREYEKLPFVFRTKLERFSTMLASRNQRMLEELAEILTRAAAQQIQVMPLKGGQLATRFYDHPGLRPMADLDLLVHPGDEVAMVPVLRSLGYEALDPDNPAARERHLRFAKPENRQVLDWDLPHPDNPRPVEVHTSLARMLWGDVRIADPSPALWRRAHRATLAGAPATLPHDDALFAHLAQHCVDHMLLRSARMIQLVDLSLMASRGVTLDADFSSAWTFPALVLARRCIPAAWEAFNMQALAAAAPPRLRRWAGKVPLNHRCGLVVDSRPPAMRRMRIHVERWWPGTWRLLVSYPGMGVPRALYSHGRSLMKRLLQRLSLVLPGRRSPPAFIDDARK